MEAVTKMAFMLKLYITTMKLSEPPKTPMKISGVGGDI